MTTTAPYGTWDSPIPATMLTGIGRQLSAPALVGEEVWWSETRPTEDGRTTIVARRAGGELEDLLPPPWNARTRVHEYGGRAWLAVPVPGGHALVFSHLDDQRLYRLDPGRTEPIPLTPAPESGRSVRYADPRMAPNGVELFAVRETHHSSSPTDLDRAIVAVDLSGRHADDPAAIREVVAGSRFLAGPGVSPDGVHLAWIAWDHPNMPWDGTELRIGELGADGRVTDFRTVLGGPAESVFQAEWADADHLYVVSDSTGWWNLYRVPIAGGDPVALCPADEEFGAPMWQLGMATFGVLDDGRLLVVHGPDPATGEQAVGVLDPGTGELTDLELPFTTFSAMLHVAGETAVVLAAAPSRPSAVVRIALERGSHDVVREALDADRLPDPAYLPAPESTTVPGPDGRSVHAVIYPPRNPDFAAPGNELPPYVVFAHGGPTGRSPAMLDLAKAYFTSRGIGVVDVDYGGSAGYGRAYRERLLGQWGVVDVEDCIAAAEALVAAGRADPQRLAIRGVSAGGWTTLCAHAKADVFAAGTSICGVTDVVRLAEITHDFESSYLDGLIGTGPDLRAVGLERSPLTHARSINAPVLLLQGADDPIVPLEQAEQLADVLADQGIAHALLVFEGEQHGFRRAESIIAAVEAELSFYGLVMGFTPPGIPPVQLHPSRRST